MDNVTILAVPMLNPDGAEKFTRRNAQGLDVNRDARNLASPEGKILFMLKEVYRPDFGFNLHDQSGRRTVGKTNKLVGIALMAPPFEDNDNDNPVRLRAKKIVSVIYQALGPQLYGHISKYDAEYMPRAFGDSMQNWGVSTVLIESGGWFEDRDNFLQKMNFIALLSCFHAIAAGSYAEANPAVYDAIPENDRDIYDLLIRDVTVIDGTGIPPFKTDVAINYEPEDKTDADSKKIGRIVDLGDMDYFSAKDTIDGTGLYLVPGFIGIVQADLADKPETLLQLRQSLENGYTTQLIPFRQRETAALKDIAKTLDEEKFQGNVGCLLYLEKELESRADSLRVLRLLNNGVPGLTAKDSTLQSLNLAKWLNKACAPLPAVREKKLLRALEPENVQQLSSERAAAWAIANRGTIRIGQVADLLLFSANARLKPEIKVIFMRGYPVFRDGNRVEAAVAGERWLPE